ncbi:terpenoid cyclases/protein prenyltransferase alpha-alpha toroid [Mycena rosella]|uniref:Terpenoid cyclases/protein prenyltransferase alpha-alpha toroid n=1 Tax=Mycena rosella TaxID=1033263 RepID=A0AAD7CX59_MYCRO|nr:terpenoid cyclases/protein prenyltransferase alpha-alpha toroid [Mycena rosella]
MESPFPNFARAGHAGHVNRCLSGLPGSQVEIDSSRHADFRFSLALGFYCIGALDLLGVLQAKTTETDRTSWRAWIWEQQTQGPHGTGFRPGPFATPDSSSPEPYTDHDGPHLVMTYTALLTLAILRDDFSQLDRAGLVKFVRACQQEDGRQDSNCCHVLMVNLSLSFSMLPKHGDTDLRTVYCAFCICDMLNDWSGVDVERAIKFIRTCRTYEGGYGQASFYEASGGPTYIALASLHLAPRANGVLPLTPEQRKKSIHWLIHNQDKCGGFRGRTEKPADACYSFWCGAALKILGAADLIDAELHASFLGSCQFKYGGIAKAPGENPDPYHTYLSIAALTMYPPNVPGEGSLSKSWDFETLDPLLNAREETVAWIREHVPAKIN